MKRRSWLMMLLALAMLALPFGSLADEGMWLPQHIEKLPFDQLKKRGLQLRPDEIYSTAQASLKDAAVIVGGGTGTFVSPDGLIITNHHVAFEAVTAASSTENNYIDNGFLASSRAAEIQAKGFTVRITQDVKDVTAEVVRAVQPGASDSDRLRAITAKQREIGQANTKDGLVAQVVEAYGGAQYHLYTYQQLNDVRLVYAPPKSIGYFGGDPDNFEWPRHCGDFAFLRAYVAPDGKPAAFNQANVPFKPKKFLALDASGIKEGDFTMVLGYPGTTFRWRESYSVDFNQRTRLPFNVAAFNDQIRILTAQGERDPAKKIENADTIFGLSNSAKAFSGMINGLERSRHVEQRRAEEAAFTKWLASNPTAKARYGEVLPKIEALYAQLNQYGAKEQALNGVLGSGTLVNVLSFAYLRALDAAKPANERNPRYSDAALPTVMNSINTMWSRRDVDMEQALLQAALTRADLMLTAGQRSTTVDQLFTGKTGAARRRAEAEFAQRQIAEAPFKTAEDLAPLFKASATELRNHSNPLVRLVANVTDEAAPLQQKTEPFNAAISRLRAEYMQGMLEWKKDAPLYPDANRTLRFTYGAVRGYQPRDAVTYHWQTSLTGVIEKDTGVEPFNVPAKLKELHAKKDFGSYVDARLSDVPVAFLTTNDITGGNSGSSVLNGRGEVIGLAFDGNFEGLGGDYRYDAALNRCLVVDIRYVLFITEKFAGADYLFKEMTIKRGKAMAAGKK